MEIQTCDYSSMPSNLSEPSLADIKKLIWIELNSNNTEEHCETKQITEDPYNNENKDKDENI